MSPAQQKALAAGFTPERAEVIAWQAGLVACLGSGLIEFFGAFVVENIRKITPRAALLAALAGIGIAFVGMDFVFRGYAHPLIGFTTIAITLVIYFGRVRFKLGIPGGFIVLALGTLIAWALFFTRGESVVPVGDLDLEQIGLRFPLPVIGISSPPSTTSSIICLL